MIPSTWVAKSTPTSVHGLAPNFSQQLMNAGCRSMVAEQCRIATSIIPSKRRAMDSDHSRKAQTARHTAYRSTGNRRGHYHPSGGRPPKQARASFGQARPPYLSPFPCMLNAPSQTHTDDDTGALSIPDVLRRLVASLRSASIPPQSYRVTNCSTWLSTFVSWHGYRAAV